MIHMEGAVKYYKDTIGLNRVDLKIRRGEVVGLFGENGAGKTTLLKAVMGLLALNAGSVTLDGQAVKGAVYEKLSFITEEGTCFPALTPLEHGAFYQEMLPRFDAALFSALLPLLHLPPNKKARALSRGMLQRLEVAVGLSRGADFVLMDEPLAGEDVFVRREVIRQMIAGLTPDRCFMIASHQIKEMEPLLSRAVVIKSGRIVADVEMEHLREEGKTLLSLMEECYAPKGA